MYWNNTPRVRLRGHRYYCGLLRHYHRCLWSLLPSTIKLLLLDVLECSLNAGSVSASERLVEHGLYPRYGAASDNFNQCHASVQILAGGADTRFVVSAFSRSERLFLFFIPPDPLR